MNRTITLDPAFVKTKHTRVITLRVCPSLVELFTAIRPEHAKGRVFEPLTTQMAKDAMTRLKRSPREDKEPGFGAPAKAGWQALRRTCATYSMNAKSVFGDAAAFAVAKRMGHSVAVSEKRYAGLVEVPPEATTLEAAMDIADMLERIGRASV